MGRGHSCFIALTLLLTSAFAITTYPAISHAKACCRICKAGIPCGNGCINKTKMCEKPKGCACSAPGKVPPSKFLEIPAPVLQATLLGITDGDTLVVRVAGWPKPIAEARIRLLRVDTPEIDHAQCDAERIKGKAAKAFVENLLPVGSKIEFRLGQKATDSFGRYLADVTLPSGRDLADTLLSTGAGLPYDGDTKPLWCR